MLLPMTDELHKPHKRTPSEALAWKAVKWRNAAGWLVIAIIAWRYLVHPVLNAYLVAMGYPPLAPVSELALADAAAIVGLPVGGSVADKMTGDV